MAAHPERAQLVGRFTVGVGVGALLAILMSYAPVVAIAGIGLLIVATWVAIARGRGDVSAMSLAGIVLGSGLVLLYVSVTTIAACAGTDTFCGNANVMPLLVFAIAAVGSGLVASILTVARAPRND
jgi:hypothetical protein